jgi:valyl-tRNA synthetase
LIERFGADALRFTLAALTMPGSDLKLSESRTEGYRHFANKIWNASRFALMNLGDFDLQALGKTAQPEEFSLPDRWIRGKLNRTIREVSDALEGYKFNEACHALYQFFWHQFCDWYVELIKPDLFQDRDPKRRRRTQKNLLEVLDAALRLLHPFMPFITEEIWQNLPLNPRDGSIMVTPFPRIDEQFDDAEIADEMELLIEVITAIRNIRGEMNVPPGDQSVALLGTRSRETQTRLKRNESIIQNLARVKEVIIGEKIEKPLYSAFNVIRDVEICVPMDRSRMEEEGRRLQKEIQKIEKDIAFVEKKLSNEQFLSRAPKDVVEEEKGKAAQYRDRRSKLEESLRKIKDALEVKA